jgi:pyruvate kinase
MARTKILATIGPSTFDKVEKLIEAGIDGIRFNMAHHRTPEDYQRTAGIIRRAREVKPELFVVGDLEGPKIRLGTFEPLKVEIGQEISIIPESGYSGKGIPIQFNDFYKHVEKGRLLLVDDGKVGLRINEISGNEIRCSVEYGELLEARKGVNTPGIRIPMVYMTKKMEGDTLFMGENGFNYVFSSFTRTAQDIIDTRKFSKNGLQNGGKVENCEGDENLASIVAEADIMMVPRGDYGMEMGVIRVPSYQKSLIERCNVLGKPVVSATQKLESMMYRKEPSRAEVTDIFNAVLDGADVVMLSGETSMGKYPIEAVRMMDSILVEAERYLFDKGNGTSLCEKLERLIKSDSAADLIGRAVYNASKAENIKAVVVPTTSGYTARMISRFRGEKPIIAVAYDKNVLSRVNAVWGVYPVLVEQSYDKDSIVENAVSAARSVGYVKAGEHVIVTSGLGNNGQGTTNMMQIRRVHSGL